MKTAKPVSMSRKMTKKSLVSIKKSIGKALVRITTLTSANPEIRSFYEPNEVFKYVNEAWGELNELHRKMDEGEIKL